MRERRVRGVVIPIIGTIGTAVLNGVVADTAASADVTTLRAVGVVADTAASASASY